MNTFYGSVLHIYAFLTHRCLKFQMEASRILRVYGSSSISKELFWSVEFAATFSQISEYHELWQPTQPNPVSLPGESHGQRSLAGYSPWGHKQSDMTEHSWTLSTFTDKHTGKKRQPLVMKDGPDTGHTKHKYSDFSSNFTYLSPPASFFLRFKFTGAAHRNNNSVFQAPEKLPLTQSVNTSKYDGGFPGGGNGNPLQYCCLENPMDRRAWRATVHRL